MKHRVVTKACFPNILSTDFANGFLNNRLPDVTLLRRARLAKQCFVQSSEVSRHRTRITNERGKSLFVSQRVRVIAKRGQAETIACAQVSW